MAWNPAELLNSLYSNYGGSGGDHSSQGIVTYSLGFSNPVLSFKPIGLNQQNGTAISNKLAIKDSTNFDIKQIKTKWYPDNRSVRDSLASQNITNYQYHIDEMKMHSNSNNFVENIFTPSIDILMNMNNYRFVYNKPITKYTTMNSIPTRRNITS